MDRMRLAAMRLAIANCSSTEIIFTNDASTNVISRQHAKMSSRIPIVHKSLCLPFVRCSAGFMHVR